LAAFHIDLQSSRNESGNKVSQSSMRQENNK